MSTPSTTALQTLLDRTSCVQTANLFALGLDTSSPSDLSRCFTRDAIFDLRPMHAIQQAQARAAGIPPPPPPGPYELISGRDALIAFATEHICRLDTHHVFSNFVFMPRQESEEGKGGKKATLTWYSLAQHHRPGEGSDPGKGGCLMGNRIEAEMEMTEEDDEGEGDGEWRIAALTLTNAWCQGDMSVMGG
ncbi:hypothetical protein F4778DRAFT_721135 [Xylariomycetidae sp. FL2044]|nr:hypothetical protein F4778DRAFT_721135 [Xylariomycetidae sp. FL2044]